MWQGEKRPSSGSSTVFNIAQDGKEELKPEFFAIVSASTGTWENHRWSRGADCWRA
jgi:hypothetical protein